MNFYCQWASNGRSNESPREESRMRWRRKGRIIRNYNMFGWILFDNWAPLLMSSEAKHVLPSSAIEYSRSKTLLTLANVTNKWVQPKSFTRDNKPSDIPHFAKIIRLHFAANNLLVENRSIKASFPLLCWAGGSKLLQPTKGDIIKCFTNQMYRVNVEWNGLLFGRPSSLTNNWLYLNVVN